MNFYLRLIDVTHATGLAAVKLTSLIRPDLLLKFSSLVSQVNDYNKQNLDKQINPFEWQSLMKLTDSEFANKFNSIAELKVIHLLIYIKYVTLERKSFFV